MSSTKRSSRRIGTGCCGWSCRRSERKKPGAWSQEPVEEQFWLLAPGFWLLFKMSESQIIERSPTATVIRTGNNGQRLTIPNSLPILPIRNIVVFPGTVMPLNVGRQKSKNLLDEVMPADKVIGVVTQRNADVEDPKLEDLHHVGVAAMILKLFKLPDGNQSIIVHGMARFRILELENTDPFAVAK